MRFTIRDLLWLTVVVAMGLGWWVTNSKRLEAVQQAQRQRVETGVLVGRMSLAGAALPPRSLD